MFIGQADKDTQHKMTGLLLEYLFKIFPLFIILYLFFFVWFFLGPDCPRVPSTLATTYVTDANKYIVVGEPFHKYIYIIILQ